MVSKKELKNKKFLVTCGPTWVPIDEVRVLSNISTGEMGHRIAKALQNEGAKVTLIQGPVNSPIKLKGIKIIPFRFYTELKNHLLKELQKKYAGVIHAAAVSDFQLKKTFGSKIDSSQKKLNFDLVPTQKIINRIKGINPKTFLVGFKLDSKITIRSVQKETVKLFTEAKCDLVIANSLKNKRYTGFIVRPQGEVVSKANSRSQIAEQLVNLIKKEIKK